MTRVAEYGFWKSPISSDLVASESVRLGDPRIDGGSIHWLERRPAERGRSVPVCRDAGGSISDRLPPPWSVRTRVHEYGGGACAVDGDVLYFSADGDQRLYRARPGSEPEPLTPEGGQRFADIWVAPGGDRLFAVCEDHAQPGREAAQSVVAVSLKQPGGAPATLLSGSDFYSNPCPSPDGERLCWLQWSHPRMPWDGTELWTAEFSTDGRLHRHRLVAGGPSESVFQPQWSPGGSLHFVSDSSGYWNLYRDGSDTCVCLHEREAEFGLPQWVFGMSTYAFASDDRIVCSYCQNGRWHLGLLDVAGNLEEIETPYSEIDGVAAADGIAVFRGASPTEPSALVRLDTGSGDCEVVRRSAELTEETRPYISVGTPVSHASGGETVHSFYYAPRNPDFAAPESERPPLIVRLHGGPTAAASDALSLSAQFWTSRGFAVVDLNYRGSTGYGRAYRERLNGQWGVVDVEDAVSTARHFVEAGLADPERLIVRGGSAGGYTVLCCLAFRDEFAAGASYYGISDLKALARDTHKFESHYHETLVGPWPGAKRLYEERSPLHAADGIAAPAVFFQGADDKVVPKDQTEAMVEALRERGVPTAYVLFEGEAHGFRDGANVKRALDAELDFYNTTLLRKGLRY